MIGVSDIARADIAMTPERTYYRFATDESIEDGDLPASKADFQKTVCEILASAESAQKENDLNKDVKVTIFVDNRLKDITVSEESLKRMVNSLCGIAEEFMFLRGFC